MSEEYIVPATGTLMDLLEDPRFPGLIKSIGDKTMVELIIAASRDTKLRKASPKLILATWWMYITDLIYKMIDALNNGDSEKANLIARHFYDLILLRLDNEVRSINGYTFDNLRTIVNVTETRQQFVRPGESVGGSEGILNKFLKFLRKGRERVEESGG